MKVFGRAIVLIMFLFAPVSLLANPIPGNPDLPLQQDQGSVCIGFRLSQKSSPGSNGIISGGDLDYSYRIRRYLGEEMTEIVAEHKFTKDEALAHTAECKHIHGTEEIDCSQHPEQCVDCNGDGVTDCDDFCYELFYFVVPDLCTPAGTAEYAMEQQTTDGDDWYEIMADEIVIDPPTDKCDDTAASVCQEVFWEDVPSDAYSDDDSVSDDSDEDDDDNDNDSGGCSVNQGDSMISLMGAMTVIGLIALAITRRRGR